MIPCDAITIPLVNLLPWQESQVFSYNCQSFKDYCIFIVFQEMSKMIPMSPTCRRDMSRSSTQAQAMEGEKIKQHSSTAIDTKLKKSEINLVS